MNCLNNLIKILNWVLLIGALIVVGNSFYHPFNSTDKDILFVSAFAFLIISVLIINSFLTTADISVRIFIFFMVILIFWMAPYASQHFHLKDSVRKTFELASIGFFSGIFLWGFVFLEEFKKKTLSWFVFLIPFSGGTALFVFVLEKGFLPVPPTGWASMDMFYEFLFGGPPFLASLFIMRKLEKH